MAKMHVNPKTKEKGRCKAKSPETCTFNNGEGLHFQTMGEADLWIAEALENEAGGPAGYLQPLKSEAPEVEPDLDALDEDIDLNEPTCVAKYDIEVELVGGDGNAFMIIGRVTKAIRREVSAEAADEFTQEATSCESYDDLLQLVMRTVEVI